MLKTKGVAFRRATRKLEHTLRQAEILAVRCSYRVLYQSRSFLLRQACDHDREMNNLFLAFSIRPSAQQLAPLRSSRRFSTDGRLP
eukprot:COSAG06_NODE_2543_length_6702_cov_2.532031_7_plen_86_part_00